MNKPYLRALRLSTMLIVNLVQAEKFIIWIMHQRVYEVNSFLKDRTLT